MEFILHHFFDVVILYRM
jgi:hypothetical protein